MTLGFNMAGTEKVFEELLKQQSDMANHPLPFRYLEHGIANGTTLSSVAKLLPKSECTGVDLVEGEYFNAVNFLKENKDVYTTIHCGTNMAVSSEAGIKVFLLQFPVFFPYQEYDFILIDGCHGQNCVTNDFQHYSPHVRVGGVIAFHDACEEDQNQSFQKHCGQLISVRAALNKLNLFNHPDWYLVHEVHGDKSLGGNGFCFFRKIA